jgi:hypothetical protein
MVLRLLANGLDPAAPGSPRPSTSGRVDLSAAERRRRLCAVASMEEAHMANERDPLRDRNPMRSDEEAGRTNEEDLIGQADEEDFEDIDEVEDDEDLEA